MSTRPLSIPDSALQPGQAAAQETGTAGLARALEILLIEDSPDDAALLERHLRKVGFAPLITRIETADAMLRELADDARPWDIILADYTLPRFSAPEALRLLKSTPRDIPFIMMSGAVSEETAVAAMRAGAHDYVSKQNLSRLGPAIERELAESASRRHKRAAEQALQQSQERFHRLVEATPLALIISDMAGLITYANAGVERLLGFRREQVDSGQLHLEQIFAIREQPAIDAPSGEFEAQPDNIETVRRALVASLVEMSRARPGETAERRCRNQNGAEIPVLLGAAILNPEAFAEEQQLAAFLVDLSEQKRSEDVLRQTEKLAASGRLAASIAHEINNPLEAITNCVYLLDLGTLDESSRRYLALIQQELARVTNITTQMLRFYRQSTRATQADLAELLETVLTLFEARLKDHGVSIVRDFRPIPTITAYEGEIRQVLANLVGNALDAMASRTDQAEGEARMQLILRLRTTRNWKTGEPSVAVTVADHGHGMSAATLRRIYEPFFSTKGLTGTGLGLWVSREILVRHHASVQVRSRLGRHSGSTFRIRIPLNRVPEPSNVELDGMPGL